ncbi:MAG: hypothetical protein FWF85_06405 [Clostridiales bacterium]|nr:hypothetical protein [Clostridiales bacterium]
MVNVNVNAEDSSLEISEIDHRARIAADNNEEFERLLREFKPFLKARVSRFSGYWDSLDTFDDIMNVSYLAFYEAVKNYNSDKGHFFPFMRTIVHMRIVDSVRKSQAKNIATTPLENDDEDSSRQTDAIDSVSMDVYRKEQSQQDLVIEIESYKQELAKWGITMDALVTHSPKHTKLKATCRQIIDAAADSEEIMQIMLTKYYLPVKKISDLTKIPSKIIERVRIFIIASLLIRAGDYEYLKNYTMG